ncbi:MAG TPA: histone deacetylase [Anaerolineae bacterium]|nr:histone deacetylase [Anaerolineae bacterium]
MMRAYHYAHLTFPLPNRHRYPLPRYIRLYHATREAGLLPPEHIIPAPQADETVLQLAHTPAYIKRMQTGNLTPAALRQLNLPWSPTMVSRAQHIVGATIATCQAALQYGYAFTLGGGTHHAHADYGSGFCVFNDIAIAARYLHQQAHIKRVAIIDCDVHQGDGTAAILATDPHLFTLSIHAQNNFPFTKATSDLDIPLPDNSGDAIYLAALQRAFTYTLRTQKPDLIIYVAGADPYQHDTIGRLALTPAGLLARDRLIITAGYRHQIPIAILMGGGYARPITETVALNLQTVAATHHIYHQTAYTPPQPSAHVANIL